MISFSLFSPIVPKTAHTNHPYVQTPALCCCRHSASANRRKAALRPLTATSRQDDAAASTAAQAFTAIGFNGTLAVAGAALCGVNLFGLFHWERLQDIQLAVELNALLLLIDALSFVPGYMVPVALLEPEQQPQQQQPFLDVSAISALTAWDPTAWGLMLAMLRAAITAPQQLPLQVRQLLSHESSTRGLTQLSSLGDVGPRSELAVSGCSYASNECLCQKLLHVLAHCPHSCVRPLHR